MDETDLLVMVKMLKYPIIFMYIEFNLIYKYLVINYLFHEY